MRVLMAMITLIMISCGGSATGPTYDLKGYESESIGGGAQLVTYQDQAGNYVVKGQVLNGVRNGTWTTFHEGTNKIKYITTYVNGQKNGIEILMNDRGQIEARTEYKNNELHGLSAKYQLGRPTEETTYGDGIFDGPYVIYDKGAKVQRKGSFKKGKQHGTLQYFNEQGEVTLQYEYKNGEKVSGGIIEKKEEVGS